MILLVHGYIMCFPRFVILLCHMDVIIRVQTVDIAQAEAEKIRLLGGSEASAIEAVGKAEAERMRLKAAAYKQYGDAAMLNLVLEALPKVLRPGLVLTVREYQYLLSLTTNRYLTIFMYLNAIAIVFVK